MDRLTKRPSRRSITPLRLRPLDAGWRTAKHLSVELIDLCRDLDLVVA